MTSHPDPPDQQRDQPCETAFAGGVPGGVPGVLARVRGEVAALGETLWAARDRAELMDAVAEVEALKSAADALLLGVVRELDATGAVKAAGWASTQDFVTFVAGGAKATGPGVVRLATAVAEPTMAPVGVALGEGWLSTTQAHVIARAVETLPGDPGLRARGVQVLLAEAKTLDATELKKLANRLLTLVDPSGEERRDEQALDRLERAAHLGRCLAITPDHAGGAWIRGRCSTEDAALIKATLIPLTAPQPTRPGTGPTCGPGCDPGGCTTPGCSHDGRDPRDHGTRMLDALVEGCRRLQSTGVLPESHGAVPRLTLTMDHEQLRRRSGFGVTETGEQLSASAVRRICCESELIPAVLGTGSEILDVGRSQRLVTAAIWKALVARDQHCRFPRCTRPPVMTTPTTSSTGSTADPPR
ncbi:MAG: endonuclease [Marmoricola sp.]|nr:endonuclease [Marmoricola sp.]